MEIYSPSWKETEQYKILYHEMGKKPVSGARYTGILGQILKSKDIKTVWDYGCGINHILITHVVKNFPNVNITGYDPVFKKNTKRFQNYITDDSVDMIISTDCLEHLWEDELDICFGYWKKKNPKYIFVTTCNRLAHKNLPDGTNAHKIIKPVEWWIKTIQTHFPDHKVSSEFSTNVNEVRDTIFFEK